MWAFHRINGDLAFTERALFCSRFCPVIFYFDQLFRNSIDCFYHTEYNQCRDQDFAVFYARYSHSSFPPVTASESKVSIFSTSSSPWITCNNFAVSSITGIGSSGPISISGCSPHAGQTICGLTVSDKKRFPHSSHS